MFFHATSIPGAFRIEPERRGDERGYFARVWCHNELQVHGLNPVMAQSSVSFNTSRGTLRGMHWQEAPHREAKLVRCIRGALYDVVVDLRPDSPSYRKYFAANLTMENGQMLFIPEGCAHGFLTLADNTEILYFISADYVAEAQRGFRWNDPSIGITWPEAVRVMSERDRNYPDLEL